MASVRFGRTGPGDLLAQGLVQRSRERTVHPDLRQPTEHPGTAGRSPAGQGDSHISGKVYNVERLGGDTFFYLNGPDGAAITVHAPGDMTVSHGDEVTVGFNGDKCHLFNQSGEAFQRLQA